jgi:hypothetical protein
MAQPCITLLLELSWMVLSLGTAPSGPFAQGQGSPGPGTYSTVELVTTEVTDRSKVTELHRALEAVRTGARARKRKLSCNTSSRLTFCQCTVIMHHDGCRRTS